MVIENMGKKKKNNDEEKFQYSKTKSFENLETVQELALKRKGKDEEANPDISTFLKAEELKGKLCGLYSEKESNPSHIKIMGSVKIDGKNLEIKTGERINTEQQDDRITRDT